jgi:hypothetical protein
MYTNAALAARDRRHLLRPPLMAWQARPQLLCALPRSRPWETASAPIAANAGRSIDIAFDEQIFVERGHVASHHPLPPTGEVVIHARSTAPRCL